MRLLLAFLLLFSTGALGQTGTLTLTVRQDQDGQIGLNRANCGANLPLTWTLSTALQPCEDLRLWVTDDTSCGNAIGAGDYDLGSVPAANILVNQPTRTISVSKLPIFTSTDGGTPPTCETFEGQPSMKVCGATRLPDTFGQCNSSASPVTASTPPTLTFDTQAPNAPSITRVIPRDSALAVEVDAEADSTITVTATPQETGGTPDAGTDDAGTDAGTDDAGTGDAGTGDGGTGGAGLTRAALAGNGTKTALQRTGTKVAGEGAVIIDGLENGVTYVLVATTTDLSDNTSKESAPATGTPLASLGIGDAYDAADGQETGGCAAAGGGIVGGAVLAILGFWLSSRRKVS